MKLIKTSNGNIVRTKEEKDKMIIEGAKHYGNFLASMGFDWMADSNSRETPFRYAKSFVEDFISGSINCQPKVTLFPNNGYSGIVVQKNIKLVSLCSHHHREIKGKCHVAYIPSARGNVIGLSKINKIVNFYAKRLQIQEALTQQIHRHINRVCRRSLGVAVIVEASHGCVSCRSLKDESRMITSKFSGNFLRNTNGVKMELLNYLTDTSTNR